MSNPESMDESAGEPGNRATSAAGKQPWHKPKVQRLQIEETASSPGSGGDGLGRASGGGGIPG